MKAENSHRLMRITFAFMGLASALVSASARTTRAATWTQKSDMPTERMIVRTEVVDGKIYAISALQGAGRLNRVEQYDPQADTWTRKADMPTTRAFLGTCVLNGKIYAVGGSTAWNGTALATVEVYDPASDTWTRGTDMPMPRDAVTSVVNGKIYAIGGFRNGAVLATVEEYDPVMDRWTKKTNMPTARELHTTNVVNGKIYVIGGQLQSVYPVVEMYDPITDTWVRKADMPERRTASGSCVLDETIYVFGGSTTRGGSPRSNVFRYDSVTDTWTELEPMPIYNSGMGVNTVGRRMYLIGGSSANYPFTSMLSTVWEFIPVPEFDFNEDGVVDSLDTSLMVDHWHTGEPRYDLAPAPTGDGWVDVQDLVALSEHLFEDYRLLAHWMLDETEGLTAYDSFGVNDADVVGDPVWVPDGGQVGGAIQLDGIDDCVSTPFVLSPGDGPFSVFAWVQGGGPDQVVISQIGGKDWLLVDADGALITNLRKDGRGPDTLSSQAIVTDGGWHHLGLTGDGTTRSLYVDDVLVAEDEPGSMPDSSEGLNLGCGANLEPGSFFSGLIDDVRIYNRAVAP